MRGTIPRLRSQARFSAECYALSPRSLPGRRRRGPRRDRTAGVALTKGCPNVATCDYTDDVLAIDPRPGSAASNCAADNIALLDLAVSRLPARFRRRVLVRLDGAGFSHD